MKSTKSLFRGSIIVLVCLFVLFLSYYLLFRKEGFFKLKVTPINKLPTNTLVAYLPNSTGDVLYELVYELDRRGVLFEELSKLNKRIPFSNTKIEILKQYINDGQAEQLIRERPELKSVTYSSSSSPKK